MATCRPTFQIDSQLNGCIRKLVLVEDDLGDQLLSCYKFGQQSFTEQTSGILPMCPGPKSCDAAFTIDTAAVSTSVFVEKCKYLSSMNYSKEVNAYLNYE